jgi:hypothetical protein
MSEATHYWPEEPGDYILETGTQNEGWWHFDGCNWSRKQFSQSQYPVRELVGYGYLGVRREAENPKRHEDLLDVMVEEYRGTQWKPDSAATAQQALNEWRSVKQAPKAADWAYKWAVKLCEIAGAR